MNPIPYGKQQISDDDIKAVVEALISEYLTQGPKIKEFEEGFASYVGADYAVAVANGTAALHLCAIALGVKPGQKVITTPITFAASANCVRYCGGEVVFADINPETYLLDIAKVQELLEQSPKGTYAGIIPVDFSGRAVDLEQFHELAKEHGLWIIEDACHAPGGHFVDSNGKEQKCGNGNYADLAIFSFHPVKHIAAGEGGMVTTNDRELYEKLLALRTHGITRDESKFQNSIELAIGQPLIANSQQSTSNSRWPGWYMEMQELGYNYRLTDFQAALALSQLKRADEGLARRREIAARYRNAFKNHPAIKDRNSANGHAFHLYVVEVEDRLGLYNYLRENKIFAQVHYIPCHLMPYYQQFGWEKGDLTQAEAYYNRCLSLPMFPSLTDEEQNFVIDKIFEFFNS